MRGRLPVIALGVSLIGSSTLAQAGEKLDAAVVSSLTSGCLANLAGLSFAAEHAAKLPPIFVAAQLQGDETGFANPAFGKAEVVRHVPTGEPGVITLIANPDVRTCSIFVTRAAQSPRAALNAFVTNSSPFKPDPAKSRTSGAVHSQAYRWDAAGRTPIQLVITGLADPAGYPQAPQMIATVAFVRE